jgi:hypothetical protein
MALAVSSIDRAAAGAKTAAREFLSDGPKKLLIGGKWIAAKSGKTFETINPANEEVLGLVAEGDQADVDDAVRAARKAFEEGKWPNMGPHQRARYLFSIADLIETHGEELAELITLDNGKPIAESRVEVDRTADTFRYYGGWTTKFYGETNPSASGFFNYTLREPIGVCGQIIPWNGPLSTISWKVAPALAFGNTLVLKPAEQISRLGPVQRPPGRWVPRSGATRRSPLRAPWPTSPPDQFPVPPRALQFRHVGRGAAAIFFRSAASLYSSSPTERVPKANRPTANAPSPIVPA